MFVARLEIFSSITSSVMSFNRIRSSNNSEVVNKIVLSVRTIVEANFKLVVSSKMISAKMR